MTAAQEAAAERVAIQLENRVFGLEKEAQMTKFYEDYLGHKDGCTTAKWGRICTTCQAWQAGESELLEGMKGAG